jgi:ribose-phosphate pyrophosphokinase
MRTLNLIYPDKGDILYKRSSFPDDQPHFEIPDPKLKKNEIVNVLCRITKAADILDIGLALNCLRKDTDVSINLYISYLLGARMDRRIDDKQPFTLAVISHLVEAACVEADSIYVLDPHSEVTNNLLRSKSVPPDLLIEYALSDLAVKKDSLPIVIIIPDKGAITRTRGIIKRLNLNNPIAICDKQRDSQTGQLTGFRLVSGDVSGKHCLIVDDICDGGGTFVGQASVLSEAGALSVSLCVTHGIFSKGKILANISEIYTTDSYQAFPEKNNSNFHVLTNFLEQSIK